MNELDRLKSKIRQCDATILEALLERNKGIEEITLYKKEHGLPHHAPVDCLRKTQESRELRKM